MGLVGYGRIGERVAKLLDAFGATVLVHDVMPRAALDAAAAFGSGERTLRGGTELDPGRVFLTTR